MQRYRLCGRA